MSAIRPKTPGTNCGNAGAAITRVHDGRSTVGVVIVVMVMTTAVAVTVGSPARIVVPASDLTVRGQDDPAKGSGIGAANRNSKGTIDLCW